MNLDVGCGDMPRGDVNCDLNVGHTLQGGDQTKEGIFIDAKQIPIFVRCDAQALPFRDSYFQKLTSYDVIEHVKDPAQMLGELLRVSRDEIEVRCPHPSSRFANMPFHLHVLTPTWFTNILSKADVDFSVSVSDARGKSYENIVKIKKRFNHARRC